MRRGLSGLIGIGCFSVLVGCSGEDSAPNYHRDIKPIVDGRCATCHFDGGPAPFSLTTYDEVHQFREAIRESVMNRTMPPWLASDGCNDYMGDYSLTDSQIDMIASWVDDGGREGDIGQKPTPLAAPEDVLISRVDRTIEMPQAYLPTASPDDYRCFLLDWPYSERKYVTGFGANAGNPRIVHHMIAYLVPPEKVEKFERLDAAEDGAGYTCFGGPGGNSDNDVAWLGAWAPGVRAYDNPAGTGIQVEPGSKIVLQMHYNTTDGAAVPDQSSVEFALADEVDRPAVLIPFTNPTWVRNGTMVIPAGEADVSHRFDVDVTSWLRNPQSFELHAAGLHMHRLGRQATLSINRPAERRRDCAVKIDNWDFDWQFAYRFRKPIVFNPGDELSLECHWDNSMANQPIIDGQRMAPTDVSWGEGTRDEMCLAIVYVTDVAN